MKCSDVDRILPDLVDGAPIEDGQDVAVQSHLKTCSECSALVSDLKLIAVEARHLADSEEPSPRVWARIALELKAEGLIREADFESLQPALLLPRRRRWNPFWLAPVAAAILAAGSYLLIQHPAHRVIALAPPPVVQQSQPQVAEQTPSQSSPQPSASQTPAPPASESARQQAANSPPSAEQPDQSSTASPVEQAAVAPSISDNQFLTEVSERAPTMRATYANQLLAVNNEIRETKAYLGRYPGDVDARQHLLEVYEQKAMLYQMALDRIQ